MDYRKKLSSWRHNIASGFTTAWSYAAPKFTISRRQMVLQCAGAGSVLVGIAQYSIPIALIIGGVGAILAVERQGAAEKPRNG